MRPSFFQSAQQPILFTKEMFDAQRNNILLIDVRDKEEYEKKHAEESRNIPFVDLLNFNFADQNKILVFHCQSGRRTGTNTRKITNDIEARWAKNNRQALCAWATAQHRRYGFVPEGIEQLEKWGVRMMTSVALQTPASTPAP